MHLIRWILVCIAALAALAACAPHRRAALVPLGGGSNCVIADSSTATRDTIYVVGAEQSSLNTMAPDCARVAAARQLVVVTESPSPDADLRDVLDRGLPDARAPRPDIVVTRDPDVLSYAARRPEYLTVILPYDRTYMLVSGDSSVLTPSQTERDALARDAVTADARGAAEPFEWLADTSCLAPRPSAQVSSKQVVAYPAGDAIARQLAERIVALAATPVRAPWLPATLTAAAPKLRVAPMASDSISPGIADGRIAAAVVAIPRFPGTRCGTSTGVVPWHGIPLIDSRAHAIIRRRKTP
jgi:hypothetical protein